MNAKIVDRVSDLERELEDMRSLERLACVNLEVAIARVQTSETQVEDSSTKFPKVVDEAAKNEIKFCSLMSSLAAFLIGKIDCVVKLTVEEDVTTDRPKIHSGHDGRHLHERDEAICESLGEKISALNELKNLSYTARDLKKDLLVAREDIAVQSSLQEQTLERVDVKLMNL